MEEFTSIDQFNEEKEHFGTPCFYCHKSLGVGQGIPHHRSYQPERIVRICKRCHFLVHRKELRQKGIWKDPYKETSDTVKWYNPETRSWET